MPDMINAPVVWEDPPTMRRKTKVSSPEAEALRTRPGSWARIFEYDTPTTAYMCARNINTGNRAGFQDGNFEAKTRTIDGKGVVYARFVPES